MLFEFQQGPAPKLILVSLGHSAISRFGQSLSPPFKHAFFLRTRCMVRRARPFFKLIISSPAFGPTFMCDPLPQTTPWTTTPDPKDLLQIHPRRLARRVGGLMTQPRPTLMKKRNTATLYQMLQFPACFTMSSSEFSYNVGFSAVGFFHTIFHHVCTHFWFHFYLTFRSPLSQLSGIMFFHYVHSSCSA